MTYLSAPGIRPTGRMTPKERFRRVANYVCKVLNIQLNKILVKSRSTPLLEARQIIVYLCRRWGIGTLKDIAGWLQGVRERPFDHTTMIHAVKQIGRLLESGDTSLQWLPEVEKAGFDAIRG